MATKKAAKKTAKKAATGKTRPAMVAAAATATPADEKHDAIYGCIVKVFHDAGLPHISTPDVKIVWSKLTDPPNIIEQLGNGVRDCIIGQGFKCAGLAGLFQILQDKNKVTTVSALIDLIDPVVTK